MSLTRYFVEDYLHGTPLWPEETSKFGYDYVMWKGRLVLRARKTGVYMLPLAFHLIDWDDNCGPCMVLYHYTNEAGFLGITRGGGHEMVMRCSTDANVDAYFGKGLYGTQFEPADERWTSKKDIQFNNYWPRATAVSSEGLLVYDRLRRKTDFPYKHVRYFCEDELAHFNDRVDFCIPVLVSESKGRKLRKADAINAFSETGPQWRDILVLNGGQHPPGEYRCFMTHLLDVARGQIIRASRHSRTFHEQLKRSGFQMLLQVKSSMRALDLKDSEVEKTIAALDEIAGDEVQEYVWRAYENYFLAPGMTGCDLPEAHRLAQIAADLGSADGKALLGYSYVWGKGVPRDKPRGASLLREAAADGSVFGTACLGECRLHGLDLPRDEAGALRLLWDAAGRDDAWGRFWLGECYYYGQGVAKSYEESAKWYRLAAEQGLAEAQFNLGYLYHNGKGVPEDTAEALWWFDRAAEQGHKGAKDLVARLHKR